MNHPVSLFLWANKHLKDWLLWDSEVIAHELNKIQQLSQEQFNRLMAVRTLLISDVPWEKWEIFLPLVQSLNGLQLNREIIYITNEPLPYLYNTIELMDLFRPQEFSDEIKRFCAAIFLHENVQYAAPPLDFCQLFISQPKYHCLNCGKIGSALPPFNFVCEDCGKVYDSEEKVKLFNFKPLEVSEKTTNVEIFLEYKTTEIQKRYEELKNKLAREGSIDVEENEVDVQVAKLLNAEEYVKQQFDRLSEELKEENLPPN